MYLSSAVVQGELFMQNGGISNGSSIAPFLCDFVMAENDERMSTMLKTVDELKLFRYVNDSFIRHNDGRKLRCMVQDLKVLFINRCLGYFFNV